MNILQLLEQSNKFVYHITTKLNWGSIKRQGIIPQDAKGEWAHIGYKNKTFLAADNSPEAVEELVAMLVGKHPGWEEWSEEWDDFYDSLIILTIDTSRVPNLEVEVDPASDGDWYQTSTLIPPEAIVGARSVEQF